MTDKKDKRAPCPACGRVHKVNVWRIRAKGTVSDAPKTKKIWNHST